MTFWDQVDMSTPVDPTHAATTLGNMLNIFTDRMGDPINDLAGAAPETTTGATDDAMTGTSSPVPEGTGVSSGFGPRGDGNHPGVDLAVPVGTAILAATGGTVTHAGDDDPGGYGSWVEITAPDGVVTRYGHLSGIEAKTGDKVTPGQRIGLSGGQAGAPGAGNSSGAHLHFEVHDPSGQIIDPTGYLAGGVKVVAENGGVATPQAVSLTGDTTSDPINDLTDGTKKKGSSTTSMSGADDDPAALDAFLAATRQHESGGDYTIYNQSGLSNASGAYQFIGTTWGGYGGYANAAEAPPEVQDAKAREMASALFAKYKSWRLVAIAWYGGPGIADQVAAGRDPGAPDQQGSYLAYGDTIASMMGGARG